MFSKRVQSITIAITLFAMSMLIFPTNSAFAATCTGSSCTGKDPEATGCASGATTLASTTLYGYGTGYLAVGKMELRYSPTCKTKWTRITRNTNINPAYPYARPYLTQSGNQQYAWFGTTSYQKWSYQVYAPSTSWKACGSLALSGSTNLYQNTCTKAR